VHRNPVQRETRSREFGDALAPSLTVLFPDDFALTPRNIRRFLPFKVKAILRQLS
jgi:hypothetical protein